MTKVSAFSSKVCVRMKQYKDELLAGCLMFILSLHPDMVALDIKAYIPALQVIETAVFPLIFSLIM